MVLSPLLVKNSKQSAHIHVNWDLKLRVQKLLLVKPTVNGAQGHLPVTESVSGFVSVIIC